MKLLQKMIPQTLYLKLFMAFVFIIACFAIFNGLFIFLTKLTYSDLHSMQKETMEIQRITTQTDVLYEQIRDIALNKKLELYNIFKQNINNEKEYINNLYIKSSKPLRFRYKSLYNLTLTFEEYSDRLYDLVQTDVNNIYIEGELKQIDSVRKYIREENSLVLNEHISETQTLSERVETNIANMELYMIMILLGSIPVFIIIALAFSSKTVSPINELVTHAQKVSKRSFTPFAPEKRVHFKEMDVLVETYNKLIEEIRLHLDRAENDANTERSLKEQAIRSMGLENALKQSELNFLQSQINPHFLFNTLNAIASMAESEGAEKSYKAIYSLAHITRFNLKNINHFVTLGEELDLIRSYLSIQRIRFGDRFNFVVNIEEALLGLQIPSMIIQPFVENAIIHGLEPKKGEGNLKLLVYDHGESIAVVIKDDGIGIPVEKLDEINRFDTEGTGFYSGKIGMVNVLKRLKMLYGENVVSITSMPNIGTEIRITLSKELKGQYIS